MIFGLSASDIALLVTAFGGGTTVQAAISAIRARHHGARSREDTQAQAIVAQLAQARASEREAWDRADAMEERYDRMTKSRNEWRERSTKQDVYHARYCRVDDVEYPSAPEN
ncbi:hypothetical protein [Cellulomonas sp. NPDC058312]|uniref:hypothetical protein n=1 Tax=Cellulomonas sp. NPDC058312 TaxID=3346441 RepID=UPI0036E4F251